MPLHFITRIIKNFFNQFNISVCSKQIFVESSEILVWFQQILSNQANFGCMKHVLWLNRLKRWLRVYQFIYVVDATKYFINQPNFSLNVKIKCPFLLKMY